MVKSEESAETERVHRDWDKEENKFSLKLNLTQSNRNSDESQKVSLRNKSKGDTPKFNRQMKETFHE